jgi:urea transport system substrate-binding protein
MESTGEAGKIQITAATYERIRDSFVCEPRHGVDGKGIGRMDTYFLVGPR